MLCPILKETVAQPIIITVYYLPQWQVPSIWFCFSRPSSSGRVGGPRTELGQCIYSEAARKCRWPWSQLYVEGIIPVSTASDTHATMWILWVNPFSLFQFNGLWTFSFSKLISEQTALYTTHPYSIFSFTCMHRNQFRNCSVYKS